MQKIINKTQLLLASLLLLSSMSLWASEETMLFHLKTSLKHNDAQLCVAYNEIWAALDAGLKVNVLIDADAVNTYKIGWFGKDGFEGYKMPENLKQLLADTFKKPIEQIPVTYGEYLIKLEKMGAKFYINSGMLVVAGIEKQMGTVDNIGPKFFKPISLKEMMQLRISANYYTVY